MTKRVAKDKGNNSNDKSQNSQGLERPKKKKGRVAILLIIALVIVATGIIFKKPLLDMISSIPVVGELVPKIDDEEQEISKEELLKDNKKKEADITRLQGEIDKLKDSNEDLRGKNEILAKYEKEQENFLKQKNDWDKNIANQNEKLFIDQFELMYPATAEEIYIVLKGNEILSKEKQQVSNAIGEMDPDQAAKAIEVLLATDVDLVKNIMLEMKREQKSEILESMTSEGAATVIKLIYP